MDIPNEAIFGAIGAVAAAAVVIWKTQREDLREVRAGHNKLWENYGSLTVKAELCEADRARLSRQGDRHEVEIKELSQVVREVAGCKVPECPNRDSAKETFSITLRRE